MVHLASEIRLGTIVQEEVQIQLRLVPLCAEMENNFYQKHAMTVMLMAPLNVNLIAQDQSMDGDVSEDQLCQLQFAQ